MPSTTLSLALVSSAGSGVTWNSAANIVDGNTTTYARADYDNVGRTSNIRVAESDPLPAGATITGVRITLRHAKHSGAAFSSLFVKWIKPASGSVFYPPPLSGTPATSTTPIDAVWGGESDTLGVPADWLDDPSDLTFTVEITSGGVSSYRFYELTVEVWYETNSAYNPIMSVGNI